MNKNQNNQVFEDNKPHVLIIDDEVDITKILSVRLKKFGYQTHAANSGAEGIEWLKTQRPDLILLDLMMPEMDGYEVTKEIRSNPEHANLPIIMLTAKVSQEDKIKALKIGIDDYVTKPYDPEELAARIESVIRRSQRPGEGQSTTTQTMPLNAQDRKLMRFLEMLQKENVTELKPEYDMTVDTGYIYKPVAAFFEKFDGTDIDILNDLGQRGIFQLTFFDRVMVCPFCSHHNLNVREVCPTDRSANISVVRTIHHYHCGYVGPESEFSQGIFLVCPKCNRELNSIGVDYDLPGEIYINNETHEKFTEADVEAQCRNCRRISPIETIAKRTIFRYLVTDRLKEVIERGHFFTPNFENELVDQEVNVYNLNYFRKKFQEELIRAQRFERPLSLILLQIADASALIREKGETRYRILIRDLTQILKESLWNVDIPARFDENSFISLLMESDKARAESVINTIHEQAGQKLEAILRLKIHRVSYPEDGTSEDQLLEKLVKGIT